MRYETNKNTKRFKEAGERAGPILFGLNKKYSGHNWILGNY
jgi:hypothetical protein